MLKKENFLHPSFGEIYITHNSRARRIILRARPDALYITLPPRATDSDLDRALNNYGEKLRRQQESMRAALIGRDFCIEAPFFKFNIKTYTGRGCRILCNEERYTLFCPMDFSFEGEERQEWIKKVIINAMRQQAKKALPLRLQQLSQLHELPYERVNIRNSRTRWGSCSNKSTISLSIYLMQLPSELVDYVLLHELCHTVEMNHSERFWKKLSNITGKDAKLLRNMLKNYRTGL